MHVLDDCRKHKLQ